MATFVFVHGAFQGGWVWQKLTPYLQSQGHAVHTPTLSGCGFLADADSGKVDLTRLIQDMQTYLELEDLRDITLVGHSFSGLICGALMMRCPDRIRQAIFVDAVIPQTNQSFVQVAGEQFAQMLEKHHLPDGLIQPWPPMVFGIPETTVSWFQARLRPFSRACFTTVFPEEFDPHKVPTSFITCTETVSPFIQAMASKAEQFSWTVSKLNTGHCPMITCPRELSSLLLAQLPR
ncbi:alpha/beta hydrolase [Desulfobulbus rhabdoformis]|uniref:alpha/beta fold hydrolase n=1 Tax=Desulfobulbus rhabdoformis TaxID=34032 RepID=UPI001963718B|nr:alpha/beta hydrolase [Desulfobulbus rhabdoformis]MBM9615540.1 alpha/beta hydrolase [Desulfobulbus rhabdoformis]